MTKQWKCTVCGYIHEGAEPPETCPICGADRSQFILLEQEKGPGGEPAGLLHDLIATFRLHPVAAHFPNGLMPTAALFLLLSLVIAMPALETAAFWLILVVVAVVPVSLGSGLYAWKTYFSGLRAPIFIKKIVLALTLLCLGLTAIALRYGQPDLLASANWRGGLYLGCLAGMLGCVSLLGHFGAKLALQLPLALRERHADVELGLGSDWSREIVARAADAILAADDGGIIRLWNQGAERIFGVPAAAAIGQSLDLIIPENLRQRHWQGWAKVMQSGASHYGAELLRVPAIRGDGSRFSAEFSILMLKDDAGKVVGVAAVLRDVSEQRERERRLLEELEGCRKR